MANAVIRLPCCGVLHSVSLVWSIQGDGDVSRPVMSAMPIDHVGDAEDVTAVFSGVTSWCVEACAAIEQGCRLLPPANAGDLDPDEFGDDWIDAWDMVASGFDDGPWLWALALAWLFAPDAPDADLERLALDAVFVASYMVEEGVGSTDSAWLFMCGFRYLSPTEPRAAHEPPEVVPEFGFLLTWWARQWWERLGYRRAPAAELWKRLTNR